MHKTVLDCFQDVLVEKEFDTLHKEILQSREIKIVHGGIIGNYVLKEGRSKRNRGEILFPFEMRHG